MDWMVSSRENGGEIGEGVEEKYCYKRGVVVAVVVSVIGDDEKP